MFDRLVDVGCRRAERRPSRVAPRGAGLEALEPRLLMAGTDVIRDTAATQGQFGPPSPPILIHHFQITAISPSPSPSPNGIVDVDPTSGTVTLAGKIIPPFLPPPPPDHSTTFVYAI